MQYEIGLVDPVTRKIPTGCEEKPAYINMQGNIMASTNFTKALKKAVQNYKTPKPQDRMVLFAICL